MNHPAPDFKLQNELDETITLASLKGKPAVLFFFPKADTPGWTIEACGFRDAFEKIQRAGATVLGISADTVAKQKKFKDKNKLPYHLLADVDKKMCEAYGVVKEKSFMGKKFMGIARTTFVLDKNSNIVKVFEDVKPAGHAEEVLASLKGS